MSDATRERVERPYQQLLTTSTMILMTCPIGEHTPACGARAASSPFVRALCLRQIKLGAVLVSSDCGQWIWKQLGVLDDENKLL